jgi:signal transduction histidine kinase/AraC-like DNA-binding protein/FixJ family two-component response regulator
MFITSILPPVRWWRVGLMGLILLLEAARPAGAQSPLPVHAASAFRLRALLGPFKTELPAIRAEQARLWRLRAKWQAEPLAFIVWRRLGLNFRALERPDSLLYCMRQAQVGTSRLKGAYPVDASTLEGPMGNVQWARQAYDSAAIYYRTQVQLLSRAGSDTLRRRPLMLLEDSLLVGLTLAQAAANTGLSLRRSGDLVVPLRYYERALRLFEHHEHTEGILWMLSLLGEAYEEQGNDTRAGAAYTRALGLVHGLATADPHKELLALAELTTYNHRLLLRRGQAAAVRAQVKTGDSLLPAALALPIGRTHPWEAYAAAATLAVRGAEAELTARAGAPTVTAALTRADTYLTSLYRVTADHAFLRAPLQYYELRAEYHALRADAGISRESAGATAVAYADSVANPGARHRIEPVVARLLLGAGQPVRALRLLRAAAAAARTHSDRLALRTMTELLADSYAALGQYDSAYLANRHAQELTDTIRAAQQYAALADVETRYQTAQKEIQIGQLTTRSEQEQRQKRYAWWALALLALALAGGAWVLRNTRRLNRTLDQQRQQLETQATELAVLDEAKSRFFANVSHELRTPLTLLVGPVEHLLGQSPAAWHPDAVRERLTMMLRNGQRLQRLVNSILDLTKLAAGRLEEQLTAVPAGTFFGELISGFAALAHERGITLTTTLNVPATLTLLLDLDKVEKIVTNLLANALKFTPAGGTVAVTLSQAAPGYCLTVQDTGPGIAPDEQERVFERFYQSRHRPATGGTGLGLALSRELAELLGGSLTLRSTLGTGSTFSFTFPALVGKNAHAPASTATSDDDDDDATEATLTNALTAAPDWNRGRPRLLVVEDDPDLRRYLHQILDPYYDVLEAPDGQTALDLLTSTEVDLVSSDAMMPGVDGIELLAHVKKHAEWRRRPFLMLTARTDLEHKLTALELGVDDYLPKPFLARELLARVRNLLTNYYERRRWQEVPAAETDTEILELVDTATPKSTEAPVPVSVSPAATVTPVPNNSAEAPRPDPDLLDALRQALPSVLADPGFTPVELAARLGLSERTLYRRLKEQTGLAPATWLREVRLNHARHLLETRALPTVAEVAYAAGFTDPSYFGQVFNKRFGKKPSEY